jgi:hypothetical protein
MFPHAMAILPNVRHERFAKAFVREGSVSRAYVKAGYPHNRGNASRLKATESVKRRIEELRAMQNVKHRITVETLLSDLAEARALALRTEQPGAAIQATTVAAKLVGLMVDRKESGAPGDFSALQDNAAIIERVRAELGDAMANAFAGLVAQAEAQPGDAGSAQEPVDIEPASGTTH